MYSKKILSNGISYRIRERYKVKKKIALSIALFGLIESKGVLENTTSINTDIMQLDICLNKDNI